MKKEMLPLDEMERSIVEKLSRARFVPATSEKRFVRDLSSGYIKRLSDGGRSYLAYIANRFRRQYQLSAEQWAWVSQHIRDEKISA
jgi:hypothetical protein